MTVADIQTVSSMPCEQNDHQPPPTAKASGEDDDNVSEPSSNDESFFYESDYEYHDDDGDNEEDEKFCAKRKRPPSLSSIDARQESSAGGATKGNLKTTGLEDDHGVYSTLVTPTTQADSNKCHSCLREKHTPILDCDMVRSWMELTADQASGIISVDPSCITACMNLRVQECLNHLERLGQEHPGLAETLLNVDAGVVAVDLSRRRWNPETWCADYQTRIQLEGPMIGQREVIQHRERVIRRLGLDQDLMLEADNEIQQDQPDQTEEENIAQMLVEHERFLKATMANTGAEHPENQAAAAVADADAESKMKSTTVGEKHSEEVSSESSRSVSSQADTDNSLDLKPQPRQSEASPTGLKRFFTNPLSRVMPSSWQAADRARGHGAVVENTSERNKSSKCPPSEAPNHHDEIAATKKVTAKSEVASGDDTTLSSNEFVYPEALDGTRSKKSADLDDEENHDHVSTAAADTSTSSDSLLGGSREIRGDGNDGWVCEICYDDEVGREDRLSLDCGHEYCRDCWMNFLLTMLEDERALGGMLAVPIYCLHSQCRRKVTRAHIRAMAPTLLPLFDKLVLTSFVRGHQRTMRWCPGPDCPNVAIQCGNGLFLHNGQGMPSAKCDRCATRFCFLCGDPPHQGRPCVLLPFDEAENAVPIARRENAVADLDLPDTGNNLGRVARGAHRPQIEVHKDGDKRIRLCPNCKIPIEKNGGCNHMRCKCGHEFCWLCMTNTTGMHASHFCGREPALRNHALAPRGDGGRQLHNPNPSWRRVDLDYLIQAIRQPNSGCSSESIRLVSEKQQKLGRFAHYYNRWNAHGQGQCFADNQCDCLAGRALDFTKMTELHSCTDTDFFYLANQRLVTSRRMLKYTYCFLYYKLASDNDNGDSNGNDVVVRGFEGDECPDDMAISSSLPTSLALFMDHQERLERMTERLSFLSENALTRQDRKVVVDMINTVDRCMQNLNASTWEESCSI